ncbi:MAG: DUF1501 domain-containing protein [Planctomycetes bacterium]|nr:DUF1501 domain-containing protein [Planctomycetota bacterium]
MKQAGFSRGGISGTELSRRDILQYGALGFGSIALSYLSRLTGDNKAFAASPSAYNLHPKPSHFDAPAKAVIMMMQNGGPGQMDLFDPKPDLTKHSGKIHTEKVEMFQPGSESNALLGSPLKFRKYGRCGMEMAEILPHLGSVADDICLVRSMYNYHNNHTESLIAINTGKIFQGRPALGSWISYALGTENQNLPAYIVLRDPAGYNTSGTLLWQNGWMPALYRGTEVSTKGTPVLNLNPTRPVPEDIKRDNLDLLAKLNRRHQKKFPQESSLEARIQNYELAARMQLAAAATLDLSRETKATRTLYGLDNPITAGYGLRCLMARRLVEAGVRFVQILPPVKPQSQPWDSHTNVKTQNEAICARCDQPSAALIKDLKQRGLLESTAVLWTGEFGRLPVSQNGKGRDHNRNAFSLILAGAGFKAGHIHGATDEIGYRSVEKPVSVADLHATILHQLGLDHNSLTYRNHGSDETLTDARVSNARVVGEMLNNPVRVG